jgi:hypothetical protein
VKPSLLLSLLLPALLFLGLPAIAHVPILAEENDNITKAMHISDPEKSWAAYGSLAGDEARYYSFDISEGEQIYLSLFKSADKKESDFRPALLLIGPGLKQDERPARLPPLPPQALGLNVLNADEKNPGDATYEPFGPSSIITLAEINITAPQSARYYAIVYCTSSNNRNNSNSSNLAMNIAGHYGLAVGSREEVSFSDRISTPIRLISVYLWEGQSLGTILIPYLVAEIVALVFFWRGSRRTSYSLAALLAGFFFLATGAEIFNQMVFSLIRAPFSPAVYITVAIAVFQVLLGVVTIRLARGDAGILQRALLAVIGTMALLAGSGLIMGPILAIASSFLPSRSGSIFSPSAAGTAGKR